MFSLDIHFAGPSTFFLRKKNFELILSTSSQGSAEKLFSFITYIKHSFKLSG